jgi:AhpC/TSA family
MTAAHEDSVNQLLQDLHAERVATWRPEDLQVNIDQRRRLVDGVDANAFVKVGDVLEPFSVPTVDGSIVELDQLLAGGPVVVIFFRFAGCPACNIALPLKTRPCNPRRPWLSRHFERRAVPSSVRTAYLYTERSKAADTSTR